MHHTYRAEQWLPFPVDLVFGFFANPGNLPRLMPAWQKTRIEKADFAAPPPRLDGSPGMLFQATVAGAGTRMTISFRPFPFSPVRATWEAEITEFVWNEHFCDVQHRGPFSYWRHSHRLTAVSRVGATGGRSDGTLLRDEVEYALPLGRLGDFANSLVVAQQMKSIFAYRQARTATLLPLAAGARAS